MTRTRYSGLWITIMVFVSTPALADFDAESRMAELQKQVEMLSKELQAIQQQLAQSKETQIQERDKSQGTPVLAAFKDGVVFEDGTGNWKSAIRVYPGGADGRAWTAVLQDHLCCRRLRCIHCQCLCRRCATHARGL